MPSLGHAVKSRLPGVLRRVFETGQRFGVNILPNHFYSDVPDFRHLRSTTYWRKPYSMHSVNGADPASQLAFASRIVSPYAEHVRDDHIHKEACADNGEPGYGAVEAAFLYCYIRSEKPQRIVQVGCGVSTCVILRAVRDESGYRPEIICIEPHPNESLRRKEQAGEVTLVSEMMQTLPVERFADLGEGGLLFVDSTHSIRVGSEVIQIIAEVLPRLSAGSRVHFHDIPFPYDYTTNLLRNQMFFLREPALLYAFLACNARYTIEASLSMLHYACERELRELFPFYTPLPTKDGLAVGRGHFPTSTYLRVIS